MHGRIREEQYSGNADWDMIAEVKKSVSIPVIGNGDLFTACDAVTHMRESGVDGLMIGRGGLGNPWIFREIRAALEGNEIIQVSLQERFNMIRRHYGMMLESRPEHIAIREMRKHIGWYLHGLRGSAKIRNEINHCAAPGEVFALLNRFFEEAGQKETEC